MSREEWLAERRKSIGGSDVAGILGLSYWSSPYQVWADKTGRIPDEPENEAMRQGTDFEDYVALRFAELSGLKTQKVNAIIYNDDFPHMHACVDRRIIGKSAGLECKTTSALNLKRFQGGDFPQNYYPQCVHYMAVNEYKTYYLAVLVLGREFHVYQLTRNADEPCPEWCDCSIFVPDSEISSLRVACANFWERVSNDTPPPIDGAEATSDTLNAIHTESNDKEVDLTAVGSHIASLITLRDTAKTIDGQINAEINAIKAYMRDAGTGVFGGTKISWRSSERSTFDRKAFEKDNPGLDLSAYFKSTPLRTFRVLKIGEVDE